MAEKYLMHYGIKNQRWGIRRFQNEDGSLTTEGRIRYSRAERKEIRSENRKAFQLGRDATIAGKAMNIALTNELKNAARYDKELEKHPNGSKRASKLSEKAEILKNARERSMDNYAERSNKVFDHAKSLVEKYGAENVENVKVKKMKNAGGIDYPVINEKVHTGREYVGSLLLTAGSMAASTIAKVPLVFTWIPSSAESDARGEYASIYNTAKKEYKERKRSERGD